MNQSIAAIGTKRPSSLQSWTLPERALSVFHGCSQMPRLSHYFLPGILSAGERVIYLDGANQFDPLLIARFTRKHGQESFNSLIRVARAFTCFQLTELVERLPAFLGQFPARVLMVTAMPDLYFDEDVRESDARASFERALEGLQLLKQYPVSVAVFSNRTASGTPPRPFFQRLVANADHVTQIEQNGNRLSFIREKTKPLLR
jgi:hypothetical protein